MGSPVTLSAADAATSCTTNSTTSTTGVRVGALSFCRLECDHDELFLQEYKRSNRTKGLKILRCFPHCCPNHIDRSYCGTSLHVIVQTELTNPNSTSTTTTAVAATASSSNASSAAVARAKQLADSVFLFARFECSTDTGLQLGDTLPSSTVVRDTQSEENPEGQWIPGIKERASTLSSAMKSVAQTINDHTLVYQLNGKVYSRWYYDWESGANKAQRLMRHVLKAYVFERCASSSNDRQSPYALRVIGIVSSPEFTVISYRRAPSDGVAVAGGATTVVGKADATPREPSPSMGMANSSSSMSDHQYHHHNYHKRPHQHYQYSQYQYGHENHHHAMDGDANKRRRRSSGMSSSHHQQLQLQQQQQQRHHSHHFSSLRSIPLRDATPLQLFEDRVLWEHANAGVVTVSKNLALLFHFLQWTPLDYYAAFVDELVHFMNLKLLEPLVSTATANPSGSGGPNSSGSSYRLEKLNCFARVLLEHAQTQPTSRHRTAPPVLSRELEMLLRAMAQAAMWLFGEPMRCWTRAFAERHASCVADKQRLRAAFVLWNMELEAQLNRFVFAQSPLQTLANAAEEIIAAVYTHELYHPKRPVVRQVLGEHGFLGWRAFVAQMRDSFIAQRRGRAATAWAISNGAATGSGPGPGTAAMTAAASALASLPSSRPLPMPLPSAVPSSPLELTWNGDWVLDVDESSWKSHDGGFAHADGLSLVAVLDLMTQFTRLRVALQLEQRVLSLCAPTAAFTAHAHADGMRLVLDGKSRVFRFTPHGVSTAMSEGADGDYIGSTRMESPDRLVVYLETFRWSRSPGTRSYHVRMRIECFKQQRLFVNGEVLETVSAACFPSEELQYMAERKIAAKMKIVNRLFVRQPMAMATAAGVPGSLPLPLSASLPLPVMANAASASAGTATPSTASNAAWRRLGGFRLVYSRAPLH